MEAQSNFDPESPFYKAQCPPWEHVPEAECQSRKESIEANMLFRKRIEKIRAGLTGKTDRHGDALPYTSMPSVPTVSQDCKTRSETNDHKGVSAIALIECVKNGKICAKTSRPNDPPERQQPKPYPPESVQAICQASAIAEANAQKDPKKRDKMMPQPLVEPYASQAAACMQSKECMAGRSTGQLRLPPPPTSNPLWFLFPRGN
jgi:hypothetical protein